MKPTRASTARPGLADHTAGRPSSRKNRVQWVTHRECAACGAPVPRAARGPSSRYCAACRGHARLAGQLRAYFRSAERLADRLGRPSVAAIARQAVAALDGEARR